MKIYLAGPDVFAPDPISRGIKLKELCAKHGAEGLFPMDNEPFHLERGSLAQAAFIRNANMALIRACDAIVANMTPFRSPSMDVGTSYEMGVGAALHKVVVGYTSDARCYVNKVSSLVATTRDDHGQVRDEGGMAVEDFRDGANGLVDNLMVACGVEALCMTAEEAILVAINRYNARRLLP